MKTELDRLIAANKKTDEFDFNEEDADVQQAILDKCRTNPIKYQRSTNKPKPRPNRVLRHPKVDPKFVYHGEQAAMFRLRLSEVFVNTRTKEFFHYKDHDNLWLQMDDYNSVAVLVDGQKILHHNLNKLHSIYSFNNCYFGDKPEFGLRFRTKVSVNPLYLQDLKQVEEIEGNGWGLMFKAYDHIQREELDQLRERMRDFVNDADGVDAAMISDAEKVTDFKKTTSYTGIPSISAQSKLRPSSGRQTLQQVQEPGIPAGNFYGKIGDYEMPVRLTRSGTTRQSFKKDPIREVIEIDDTTEPEIKYSQIVKNEPKEVLVYPLEDRSRVHVSDHDMYRLLEGEYLNDIIIAFYLKYVQLELMKPEVLERVQFFTSYFYERLTQKNPSKPDEKPYDRIKKWTKKMGDLFSKDFLVIPINEHTHWFTAIICYPAKLLTEYQDGQEVDPCFILVLDSLKGYSGRNSAVIRNLKQFLVDEAFETKGRQCSTKDIAGGGANVPQQPNGCDCGVYLLHYIELFLTRGINEDYTAFRKSDFGNEDVSNNFKILSENKRGNQLKQNWFKHTVIQKKRHEIMELISSKAEQNAVIMSQREKTYTPPTEEYSDDDVLIISHKKAPTPVKKSTYFKREAGSGEQNLTKKKPRRISRIEVSSDNEESVQTSATRPSGGFEMLQGQSPQDHSGLKKSKYAKLSNNVDSTRDECSSPLISHLVHQNQMLSSNKADVEDALEDDFKEVPTLQLSAQANLYYQKAKDVHKGFTDVAQGVGTAAWDAVQASATGVKQAVFDKVNNFLSDTTRQVQQGVLDFENVLDLDGGASNIKQNEIIEID